jgi:tripartite ATP-independent transporter DctP family solute receptor
MKKIIKIRTTACFLAILLLLSGCGPKRNGEADGSKYPKMKILLSTTVSEQSNATLTGKLFAEEIAEKTDGNIEVVVYSSDQLSGGNMSKGVEMLTQGAIDCAFEPVDVLAVLDSRLLALSLPWTFDSYEEAEECLNSEGGDFIREKLRAKNIETLGFIHNGFRQLTNSKRSVVTPEDLKNMKLRVPGGDVFMEFFKALGADPVSMSFSELFTALQQGTVDGQENGFDLITTNKFYEVQDYITGWNYSYGAFAMAFSSKTWESLNEDTQELFRETAEKVCRIGCENVVNNEEKQKQEVADYGCELTELNEEQIMAFKEQLDAYYEKMTTQYGEETCKAFGIEQ